MNLARTWRNWILGWVFLALVGIQVIESSHIHKSAALEDACPVCHVMAHQQLDVAPPPPVPMAAVLFLLFILSHRRQILRIAESHCASYYSRAPPYRFA